MKKDEKGERKEQAQGKVGTMLEGFISLASKSIRR